MCNFLSWVLTENEIYTDDNSSCHTAIIEKYKLRDDPHLILKVEIVPPSGDLAASAAKWDCRIDQDIMPRWFDAASCRRRVLRATNSWMRLRPWWTKTAEVIESHRAIAWLHPDGNPAPSWRLFTASSWAAAWDAARAAAWDAAWDAARAAAWDAARAAARDAAWAAAWDAARAAAWDAARAAAWDAARAAARAAAWAAAWDAVINGVCADLPIEPKHRDHIAARMNAWRKGYAVMCDVGGVLYVYAAQQD